MGLFVLISWNTESDEGLRGKQHHNERHGHHYFKPKWLPVSKHGWRSHEKHEAFQENLQTSTLSPLIPFKKDGLDSIFVENQPTGNESFVIPSQDKRGLLVPRKEAHSLASHRRQTCEQSLRNAFPDWATPHHRASCFQVSLPRSKKLVFLSPFLSGILFQGKGPRVFLPPWQAIQGEIKVP